MKQLEKVYIPYNILDQTSESLRMYGEQDCEGLVLWLGNINNDKTSVSSTLKCRIETA